MARFLGMASEGSTVVSAEGRTAYRGCCEAGNEQTPGVREPTLFERCLLKAFGHDASTLAIMAQCVP